MKIQHLIAAAAFAAASTSALADPTDLDALEPPDIGALLGGDLDTEAPRTTGGGVSGGPTSRLPEPATWALVAAALLGLRARRRPHA
jgi:hypothetical protein